ncbi:hypothetical protein PLICRDRAFT_89554 [Plicaturopsis crispa FD-325 SS-3]|nr:hypothetical protein PLICRDRAFT_89554 [Plicaturopsis crispa FD-325 SS-3]
MHDAKIDWVPPSENRGTQSQAFPRSQPIPFARPQNEADASDAINSDLLNPMWQIAEREGWIPSPNINPQTRSLRWSLELRCESYMKPRPPVANADPENATKQRQRSGTIIAGPKAGQSTKQSEPESDSDDSESDSDEESDSEGSTNMPGVRVDKIFVLNNSGFIPSPGHTRLQAKVQEKAESINHGGNCYLSRGQIWEIDEEADWHALKALLPVEIKMLGHVDLELFFEVIKSKQPFQKDQFRGRTAGMQYILMQALRYADHYGTDFITLSDGASSIFLSLLPENTSDLEIHWIFLDGSKKPGIRLLMAFALWKAGDDMKDKLDPRWRVKAGKRNAAGHVGKGKGKELT